MAAFVTDLHVNLDNRCFTQVDLHVFDSTETDEVVLELIDAAPRGGERRGWLSVNAGNLACISKNKSKLAMYQLKLISIESKNVATQYC